MKTISRDDYVAEAKAQGVEPRHFACKCVVCGTIQSMQLFVLAGSTSDDAESQWGFSCIGRWTNAGEHKRGSPPGRGCNWTLGGLLRMHKLEVIDEDGRHHPRFELATPAEARELRDQVLATILEDRPLENVKGVLA